MGLMKQAQQIGSAYFVAGWTRSWHCQLWRKKYHPACTEQYLQHPLWFLQLLLSEALVPSPRPFSMKASIQLYQPGLEEAHQIRHTDSWWPQPTA